LAVPISDPAPIALGLQLCQRCPHTLAKEDLGWGEEVLVFLTITSLIRIKQNLNITAEESL